MPSKTGKPGGKKPTAGKASFGKKPRPQQSSGKPSSEAGVYVRDDSPRLRQPRKVEPVSPQINKRLGEMEIDRQGHDGRGIAQVAGKTLFVAGAIAGERVTARLVADHSRFTEARVDQVLRASPERVQPPCPHYVECGGCQLQHMQPEAQLAMKQNVVLEQLERWGGVKPAHTLAPVSTGDTGYRSRARLGVWYETDGKVTLGFRQQNSKTLTNIQSCLVLVPELDRLLPVLRAWLENLQAAKAVTHIELIQSSGQSAVIFRHTRSLTPADKTSLVQMAGEQGCQVWLEPNGSRGLTDIEGQAVDPRLVYRLDRQQLDLRFHPQDFTQVNHRINVRMVSQALELLTLKADDKVVDFFCGIGNFTLAIAQAAASVTGIEAVDAMVERGCENARQLAVKNAHFLKADLTNLNHTQVLQLCREASAILLDPPRDGAKELVMQLKEWRLKGQLKATRIVYVSCNPATLARDAGVLVEAGYRLETLGVLDMFPHTSHVESMALFLL
jgi:23S rRNA (uracil1939-C5)-methyltransferase